MKGRIVVTEPMSTAFNFLEDIRERGYEPVVLESFIPEGYARDGRGTQDQVFQD